MLAVEIYRRIFLKHTFSQRLVWILISTASLVNHSGCGKGTSGAPELAGLSDFRAEIIDRSLYLAFRVQNLSIDTGATIPIPGLNTIPISTIALSPDLSGQGALFQAVVALESLNHVTDQRPLSGLPDGRLLPEIRGGVLPRWDVEILGQRLSLYLSDEAFGIYFGLPFSWKSGAPFLTDFRLELMDPNGNRFGVAHWLGGTTTGIFVLVPFTTSSRR